MNYNTESIYKYLDVDGLLKTLESRKIQFSSPTIFNDPFDMLLDEIYAYDYLNESKKYQETFEDFLKSQEFPYIENLSPLGHQIKTIYTTLRENPHLAEDIQKEIDNYKSFYNVKNVQLIETQLLRIIKTISENTGVFCGSRNGNNNLLWAHYTNNHQGGVINFKPSLKNSSMLLTQKPVTYTKKRPYFYTSHEDFILKSLIAETELSKQLINQVTYTKSFDWSYEEEVRVAVPEVVKANEKRTFYYNEEEVVEVYLGLRATEETISKVKEITTCFENEVILYKMETCKTSYNLIPKQLT